MAFSVLIPQPVHKAGITVLRNAGLEVVQPPGDSPATLLQYIGDCDAVLLRTVHMTADVLAAARKLRVIARHGVGVDNVDLTFCAQHGIQVTNAPEANTVAVTEHTLALLLAVAKNLRLADRETRAGNFDARHWLGGIELRGRCLGVIGLGRIGRSVARRAADGLGMAVLGHDPGVRPETVTECPIVDLDVLLGAADVVTLHVPLTAHTAGSFGPARFAVMKQGAYLVNCSRGGVVDEPALQQALRDGTLAGAALDVFADEPLPAGHPLTDNPRVLLTPHMAAHTEESLARMAVHAADGIVAVARGQRPQWPVPLPDRSR